MPTSRIEGERVIDFQHPTCTWSIQRAGAAQMSLAELKAHLYKPAPLQIGGLPTTYYNAMGLLRVTTILPLPEDTSRLHRYLRLTMRAPDVW